MWQTICLCLPATSIHERRHVFSLLNTLSPGAGNELAAVDIGLCFLPSLSPEEALTVLEERHELVIRSQELVEQPLQQQDIMQTAIKDHMQTLLAAERAWLERTLIQLRATYR